MVHAGCSHGLHWIGYYFYGDLEVRIFHFWWCIIQPYISLAHLYFIINAFIGVESGFLSFSTAVSAANGTATKISTFSITNRCWFLILTANGKGRCYPPLPLKRLCLPHGKTVWPPIPANKLYIMRPQNGAASFIAIATTNGRCCPPLTVNGHHLTPTPSLRNIKCKLKCKAFCIVVFAQRCSKSKIRICIDPIFSTVLGCTFTHFVGNHW